mgnify:CR=1 FL=1
MPGEGGGVYQNGTMNVQGKVIIKENNRVELTQGGGNVGATKPDPTPIHQSNVHLPETSTNAPPKTVVTVVRDLAPDSGIGVLTNTSPEETDTGTIYTIIAVPGSGYADIADMETYFTHDQLARNNDAYQVKMDKRTGGTNLILDYSNGVLLQFTKVDARDHTNLLSGAVFELYTCASTDEGHQHVHMITEDLLSAGTCWQPYMREGEAVTSTSDDDGTVNFGNLPNGDYMLVERDAPEGFERPYGQWMVQINNAETGLDRAKFTGRGERLPPAFVRVEDTQELLLPNMVPFAMPTAGAIGQTPFVIAGVLTIITSLALLLFYKASTKKTKGKYKRGVQGRK